MIITCEQCLTRFRLADDRVKPGGTKVRCAKCQHVFTIQRPTRAPVETGPGDGDIIMERSEDAGTPRSAAVPEPAPATVEPPPFALHSPAEFDFGFTEPATEPAPTTEAGFTVTPPAAAAPLIPPEDEAARAAAAATPAGAELSFAAEPAAAASADLPCGDGTDEDEDRFIFIEESDAAEGVEAFPLPGTAAEEASPFDVEDVFGKEEESDWSESGAGEELPLDFDAPYFASDSEEQPFTRSEEGGLGFGEISFSEPAPGAAPAPEPVQPTPPAAAAATPSPAPPAPGPAVPRPPAEEQAPSHLPARNRSSLLVLAGLLVALCGVGGYVYFADHGRQFIDQLRHQLTGEAPAGPMEQRIGLNVAGSSYVDNRDTGTLLVIQGTVTNNFAAARSAITVKGLLLDAGGKVLQQQTVYCGNHLSEERLQGMKYAQIEEAMNNQFGDGLLNMNVKPGASLRFTVVFRNLPQGLDSISVEVADSKPAGL